MRVVSGKFLKNLRAFHGKDYYMSNRGKTTYLKYEGREYTMNSGLICKVIKYVDKCNVLVQFSTGKIYNVELSNLLRGAVRDRFGEKVCGVGVNDVVGSSSSHKEIRILWKSILDRCYGRVVEAYKDCSICERWEHLSNFIDDIQKMENFDKLFKQGWSLDKDILVKGNKVYSPDTCCIVPKEINQLFIYQKRSRGDYPIGVILNNTKTKPFTAQLSKRLTEGNQRLRKNFKTVEEAFLFYKVEKEKYIKDVANIYKDEIDVRCYNSMMNWVVCEND